MSLQTLLNQLYGETHAWIESQRNVHWPMGRPLSAAEKSALGDCYSSEVLKSARVRANHEIENPPFYWQAIDALKKLGIQTKFSLTGVSGITFVDCVVVPQPICSADVLFHELAHVVQYRLLGARGFSERYVNGLASAGFVYERNPMEAIAFELQERFLLGLRFDVEAIIERGLRN